METEVRSLVICRAAILGAVMVLIAACAQTPASIRPKYNVARVVNAETVGNGPISGSSATSVRKRCVALLDGRDGDSRQISSDTAIAWVKRAIAWESKSLVLVRVGTSGDPVVTIEKTYFNNLAMAITAVTVLSFDQGAGKVFYRGQGSVANFRGNSSSALTKVYDQSLQDALVKLFANEFFIDADAMGCDV